MAGDMNRATLIGRLGKDPESRSLNSGGKVVNLRIATSETWRDKQTGERQERTQWHQVVIWNEPLGKIAEQYLKKGSKVLIEGQIETRKYEKDGEDRYATEIVLRPFNGNILLLDGKQDGDGDRGGRSDDRGRDDRGRDDRRDDRGSSSRGGRPQYDAMDDEVPF